MYVNMKYLIDTHTFLWIIEDSQNLTDKVKKIYLDNSNEIYLSVASLWEMAIKISLKKLTVSNHLSTFIDKHAIENNIRLLDVQPHHVIPIEELPNHHKDPFDRLLVCQCIQEKMVLLSKDKALDKYAIKRIW